MKYKFVGRNLEVSQRLKTMTEKKLDRLSKFFTPDTTVFVTFKEEGRRSRVEVTIPVKGTSIRAEVEAEDPYTGLDAVMEKLERRIERYRAKLSGKAKSDHSFREDYFAPTDEAPTEAKVVRVKEVEAMVMDREEACLQMELTGHDFYVYRDADSQQLAVVYRRREGDTYGLLEIR
jgi:putative sigma-54 modulation protein